MERQCRFCLDTLVKEYDSFISPCACSGTSQYIHESCLRKWFNIDPEENSEICPVCNEEYAADVETILERIPKNSTWSIFFMEHIVVIGLAGNYGSIFLYHDDTLRIPWDQMKYTSAVIQTLFFLSFLYNFRVNNLPRYRSRIRDTFAPFCLLSYTYILYRVLFLNEIIQTFIITLPMNFIWLEHLRLLKLLNEAT